MRPGLTEGVTPRRLDLLARAGHRVHRGPQPGRAVMAESDIRTVRMPCPAHPLRDARVVAHMARGQADPHRRRSQRAEERKRRGSKLLVCEAIPAIPVGGHILHQMQSGGDPCW